MNQSEREKKEVKEKYWRELWPGCEGRGFCMQCGELVQLEDESWICGYWLVHGETCPEEKIQTRHRWHKNTCAICGTKRGWVTEDGRWFRSVREAKKAGVPRRLITPEK